MDFAWTEEERVLYEQTRKFAAGPLQRELGDANGFDVEQRYRRAWRLCANQGVLAASVPRESGGLGLGALATARLFEAMGAGCAEQGFVFSVAAHLFACVMPVVESGSAEVKKRFLPGLIDGTRIAGNAISESSAGSDVHALDTEAVRSDDGFYRVTGEKNYVTNGPVADVYLVYGKTNPAAGFLGISAFLIERETAGVTAGAAFDKIGLQHAHTGSVYFDGCRVPSDQLVGGEGEGAAVFRRSMHWERTCLFASYVGAMERGVNQCVEYARSRKQFGKAIGSFQAVSHRISEMKLRLEAARLLLYRACWLMDHGGGTLRRRKQSPLP